MFFLFYIFLSNPIFAEASLSNSKLKNPHSAHISLFFQNSSKKSYLLYQAKQRDFKERRTLFLKDRKKQLKKIRKQKELKNKIEELEFQSHLFPDKIPSLSQKLSSPEESFWDYQNQMRLIETDRKRAFLQYKKQHQNYKKRKRAILQARLKTTKLLRQKLKSINPIAETPQFESF